jgi:hypothetical protein
MAASYGGQRNWQPRGSSTNEYIVEVGIEKDVHYQSEWRTIFGRLNGMRDVNITKVERDGEEVEITGGGESSPVWEKTFGEENREARFAYEEPLNGTRTYGQQDLGPGAFTAYKHEVIQATQIDSPTFPILDRESQLRQSALIPISDVIPRKKKAIRMFVEKWKEIDAFSAICDGYSEPALDSTNGGLNLALPGASAGQNRSCYNTWVAGASALTVPNFTRSTHENTLADAVYSYPYSSYTNSSYGFTYELHQMMSWQISALKFPSVKIGNAEYRAGCIIDPWLLRRLVRPNGTLATYMEYALPRSEKNPVLDGMQTIELDNILYIPSMYWQYFRPTPTAATGSTDTMVYRTAGTDPFDASFANTSKCCLAWYFTSGALLRGRSTKVWFTASGEGQSDAGHKKGTTFAIHYDDVWKRTEWVTKDGRSAIANDRSLMLFAGDPGPGIAFSS